MRRINIKPINKGVRPITIGCHPKFYNKMEELRKQFSQNNISLSQMELTNMIATKIKIPKVNLLGEKNVKKNFKK